MRLGVRRAVYLVSVTGPSSPFREYITTRFEGSPSEAEFEQELAAGTPSAARAASRLLSGRAERDLQYAREMSLEDTKYVDGC